MKLISGIVGLVVFAVSLPAASQSSQDVARIGFYDKVWPNPSCNFPETQKIIVVRGIENRFLKFSEGQYDYSNFDNSTQALSQIKNATVTFCNDVESRRLQKTAAQVELDEQLKTAAAAYSARFPRSTTPTAEMGRPGAGAPVAATGSANLRAAIGDISSAEKAYRIHDKEGKSGGSGGERTGVGSRSRGNTDANNRSGSTGANVIGQLNSAAKVNGQSATAVVQGPSALTDGAIIQNREITLTDGSVYRFDQSKHKFTSAGKDDLDYVNMVKTSGCSDESCHQALEYAKTIPEASQLAQGAAAASGANALDATATGQIAQIKTEIANLKAQSLNVTTAAQNTKCVAFATATSSAVTTYALAVESCMTKASMSDNLCSLVRSPKAILVQKLMSVGTMVISRQSSASDNCSAAQNFSRLAQTGLTIANVACTGMKYMCDFACASAESAWTAMQTANAALLKCGAVLSAAIYTVAEGAVVETAGGALQGMIASQKPHPPAKIAQCQKYEADIANMALQILSVADASKQAKACKEALAAGGSGGGGGGTDTSDVSMDEFCKVPGQALNPPCKCRTEPTAQGCPGHLASTLNKDNIATNKPGGGGVNTNNVGGAATLAAPGGLAGFQTGLNKTGSALSKEAKDALGVTDPTAAAAGGSGIASNSNSSVGSDGVEGSGKLGSVPSADAAKKLAEKKKQNYGDFDMSGVSFGSLKFGADGKAVINGKKYSEQEIKVMAARKIASEEFFQQVTTASGKSNWDKVRVRYDENRGSLYAP